MRRRPRRAALGALRRLEHLADSFLSVGAPVLARRPSGCATAKPLQRPVRERIARLATLKRAITAGPRLAAARRGGWSAVLRLPATQDDDAWVLSAAGARRAWVQRGYFLRRARRADTWC
ncbi:MAG: hypothetical protein IPN17_18535 [Deltaproteobacteria bacterium]|nr:hypothetical protein [Deltaproteobacteria bacterium]